VTPHPPSLAGVFIYSSVGSGSSPLSCGVFLPLPLLHAFLLLLVGQMPPPLPSLDDLFIYSHVGSGPPPSPVEFSSHCRFYKLSCSWLLGRCCCSCLLRPTSLFTVPRDCPPTLFGIQGTPPSLLCVFFYCCLLFSLFSMGGVWSFLGAMPLWPKVVCGSTTCCLAHLVVCIFPSGLGAGI
jgi:hypothetical protein